MASDYLNLTPGEALGIPVAIVGAIFLALGTQLQHSGVGHVGKHAPHETAGFGARSLMRLIKHPNWVMGTILLGLAIVFQLFSLHLAPLTVVQPLGAVALVITAYVNARVSGVRLDRLSVRAIAFCVGGVGLFVTVAAITTTNHPIGITQLVIVLVILAVVLLLFGIAFALFRRRFRTVFYIVGAGVLFGFVATLAKVVIDRVDTIINLGLELTVADLLTVLCVLGIAVAALGGGYLVQTAYASGPPDLVVAGLTVIDPLVAVAIGLTVLNEAAGAPWWAGVVFVVAGVIAVYGVFQLATHHPHVARSSVETQTGGT